MKREGAKWNNRHGGSGFAVTGCKNPQLGAAEFGRECLATLLHTGAWIEFHCLHNMFS